MKANVRKMVETLRSIAAAKAQFILALVPPANAAACSAAASAARKRKPLRGIGGQDSASRISENHTEDRVRKTGKWRLAVQTAPVVRQGVILLALVVWFLPASLLADTHYVNAASASPVAPYSSWSNAATTIQDAVDVADAGDTVLVTNGTYATGGRLTPGYSLTNRLVVLTDIVVRSVNGPSVTVIEGKEAPANHYQGCGDASIRCVYMTAGVLDGFTLTNGFTRRSGHAGKERSGGGVYADGAVVTNCVLAGNRSDWIGGGAAYGTYRDCVFHGNSTRRDGGGVAYGTLSNCVLRANSGHGGGGGASDSTLYDCELTGNSSGGGGGGGATECTLYRCLLKDNVADYAGGGTVRSTLYNCRLLDNRAVRGDGGGADGGKLYGCFLSGNQTESNGGGANGAALYGCTVTGNRAGGSGGGVSGDWSGRDIYNSVVYHNSASFAPDVWDCACSFTCTSFDPGGTGNITDDPMLVSHYRLATNSPCIGAGSSEYAQGVDIDGEVWQAPPSMGCDELISGAISGPLGVAIEAAATRLAADTELALRGAVTGRVSQSRWNFGDGTGLTNRPFASHAWTSPGDYQVVLTVFNADHPAGLSATTTVHVVSPEDTATYVWTNSPTPTPPYTSWATAAHTLQEGVAAQELFGGWVWVTNGIYREGGTETQTPSTLTRLKNRLLMTNDVVVRSVNGASATVIEGAGPIGDQAVRCVFMTAGMLDGFTITNGHTTGFYDDFSGSGAGVHAAGGGRLRNCVISGNTANNTAGGAYHAHLENCVVTANRARSGGGGGAYGGSLAQCVLSHNVSKGSGGGAYEAVLRNCTLWGNEATRYGGGGAWQSVLLNCAIANNTAAESGGGIRNGHALNCTISGNRAGVEGGGSSYANLTGCIVHHNAAPQDANVQGDTCNYCCTVPDPGGTGNITNDPALLSYQHIAPGSPCVGAGAEAFVVGTDIDGDPWGAPPAIGCDEPVPGIAGGPLTVMAIAESTNVVLGNRPLLSAKVEGNIRGSHWDLGDGTVLTDRAYVSHAWSSTGRYDVVLTAFNDDHPGGVSATVTVHVLSTQESATYVWTNSPSPTPPYRSWATAAHTIQDAVDAQETSGGWVWVTNGVYRTGGRPAAGGSLSNRVVIDSDIVVKSVNGPATTIIEGKGPRGDSATRCMYMSAGCLEGFALTAGHTRADSWASAGDSNGGGVYALAGLVTDCLIHGNAGRSGGGACGGTLRSCVIRDNRAESGYGAGAFGSELRGCVISGNRADLRGGGTCQSTLYNCTATGNSAQQDGGGSFWSTHYNSIVYHNEAPVDPNVNSSPCHFTCTTPLPPVGEGNITNDPVLVTSYRLAANSPCIGAGAAAYAPATDVDGQAWRDPPSMGCDEFIGGTMTGAVDVAIVLQTPRLAAGAEVELTASIDGAVWGNAWDMGDGTVLTNRVFLSYTWGTTGEYDVVLAAFSDEYPDGVSATTTVEVVSAQETATYVWTNSPGPAPPHTSWATAAHTIQEAIDAQDVLWGWVCVTNGVYRAGGRLTPNGNLNNRVVITNDVVLKSVNGPGVTSIEGEGPLGGAAVRCVYQGGGVLDGFTLTGGHAGVDGSEHDRYGGGVFSRGGSVTNCVFVDNHTGGWGGGAYNATLYNCTFSGNTAGAGGGTHNSVLYGCTLTRNRASWAGGGVAAFPPSTYLYNCVLASNICVGRGGGAESAVLYNCELAGNSAGEGGGASFANLYNCRLVDNRADNRGGGSYESSLYGCELGANVSGGSGGASYSDYLRNCVLFNNSARTSGGGAYDGELRQCTMVGNSAQQSGGGVYMCRCEGCIIVDSGGPASENHHSSVLEYCCTVPASGEGCVTSSPQFRDRLSGDLRLLAESPCIDAGANKEWMFDATDRDGNPRIFNGTVDIGAYEFTMLTDVEVLLEGPFRKSTRTMSTELRQTGLIPTNAVYLADSSGSESVPSDTTDWILLELLDTNSLMSVANRSAFLRRDGRAVNGDGEPSVRLECSPGHYYLVAKHRNHCAVMSAWPLAYTNALIAYDFTTGMDKCRHGAGGCVQLSSNAWGMIAGDANADGQVTWVDAIVVSNSLGRSGYLQADVNLDGVVTGSDIP